MRVPLDTESPVTLAHLLDRDSRALAGAATVWERSRRGTGRDPMEQIKRDPTGGGFVGIFTMALLGIVGIAPMFGMAAAMNADYCFENQAMICSAVGRRLVVIAPFCGAGTGLVVAVLGSWIPRLRRFRIRCLFVGYGLASIGFVISVLIAGSAS